MPKEDQAEYQKVVEALQVRFGFTSEVYRQKFRACKQEIGDTFAEWIYRCTTYFRRWQGIDSHIIPEWMIPLMLEHVFENIPSEMAI